MLADTDTINMFSRFRIEDILLEIIKNHRYVDKIMS